LDRDNEYYNVTVEIQKRKIKQDLDKINDINNKISKSIHMNNIKYFKNVIYSFIDMSQKYYLYKCVSKQENIPKELWNEWIYQIFNELPLKLKKSQSDTESMKKKKYQK